MKRLSICQKCMVSPSAVVSLGRRLLERFSDDREPLRLGWAWAGLGRHTHSLIREWQTSSQTPIDATRPDDLDAALAKADIVIAIVKDE